jgi:hypothetical protein
MLWPKVVPPGSTDGTGYLSCDPTNGYKQGRFVYLNGVFTSDAGPSGLAGGPGYASSGDRRYSAVTSASGTTVSGPVYPFKVYHFQPESSDLSLDTAVSGQNIVVYTAGEFETDQHTGVTDSVSVGTLLYLNDNGLLTTGGASNGRPVAVYLGKKSSYDSNYTSQAVIWFRLLPWPAIATDSVL